MDFFKSFMAGYVPNSSESSAPLLSGELTAKPSGKTTADKNAFADDYDAEFLDQYPKDFRTETDAKFAAAGAKRSAPFNARKGEFEARHIRHKVSTAD